LTIRSKIQHIYGEGNNGGYSGPFDKEVFDELYIIYTHMFSNIKMEPSIIKLLPLELDTLKEKLQINESTEKIVDGCMEYEPDPEYVFNVLVRKYIKGVVYGAFVESFTSEQNPE